MNKILLVLLAVTILIFTQAGLAKTTPPDPKISSALVAKTSVGQDQQLLNRYSKELVNKDELLKLKKDTLGMGGKAVPTLIEVMKNGRFPEKNRWVATFLLGQLMGDKAAPFLTKFTFHPSWVMRIASLKTLLALKQKNLGPVYARLLKDQSMIVRYQALDNIHKMSLSEMAPYVWAMLYDKENYYDTKSSKKRTTLIKDVIKTVGDLQFKKAERPLFKMVQNKRYDDIFEECDYALSKITGKPSPNGDKGAKRAFWSRQALNATI
jgi:hypothetical protein